MCKGVSRQVQVVSPAGFNGIIYESSPELCTGAHDVWHTAGRTQMSYSSVALNQASSYLGVRGTDQGLYVILLFLLLMSVHCDQSRRQTRTWPNHLNKQNSDSLPPSQTISWKMLIFWLCWGVLQQYVVNIFKWESLQMVTIMLVQSIINKLIDFGFVS